MYLKGISTGDFSEALSAILGDKAKGLSANTVCKLKAKWLKEYQDWCKEDLSTKRYVYWWADGVHSNVRMDDRLCLLVIIGVTEQGRENVKVFLKENPSTAKEIESKILENAGVVKKVKMEGKKDIKEKEKANNLSDKRIISFIIDNLMESRK